MSADEATMAQPQLLKLRRDVRFRVIDREAVVLRQEAAEALVINEVGARILQLVDGETSLDQMLDQLNNEFVVDREELRQDCLEFVHNLQDIGILEALEPTTAREPSAKTSSEGSSDRGH